VFAAEVSSALRYQLATDVAASTDDDGRSVHLPLTSAAEVADTVAGVVYGPADVPADVTVDVPADVLADTPADVTVVEAPAGGWRSRGIHSSALVDVGSWILPCWVPAWMAELPA